MAVHILFRGINYQIKTREKYKIPMPTAPLPPKAAYDPFGRCIPEAQNVFVNTLIVIASCVPMFLFHLRSESRSSKSPSGLTTPIPMLGGHRSGRRCPRSCRGCTPSLRCRGTSAKHVRQCSWRDEVGRTIMALTSVLPASTMDPAC